MIFNSILFLVTICATILYAAMKKYGLIGLVLSVINFALIVSTLASNRGLAIILQAYTIFGNTLPMIIGGYVAISVICLLINLISYVKDRQNNNDRSKKFS